jgi:hypothetical protein
MAGVTEIRVERKQRNIWPWVLGLLLLGLVIWAASEAFEAGRRDAVDGTAEVGVVRYDDRRLPLPIAHLQTTPEMTIARPESPEPIERAA